MGIAALILCILAFLFSIMPLLCALALLLLIPGLILTIFCFCKYKKAQRSLKLPIAAAVFWGISFVLVICGFSFMSQVEKKINYALGTPPESANGKFIEGFGYKLGAQIAAQKVSAAAKEAGYIEVASKNPCENFNQVRLYFTPKTLTVYKIEGIYKITWDYAIITQSETGVITSVLKKKYGMIPAKTAAGDLLLDKKDSTLVVADRLSHFAFVYTDKNLEKQKASESGDTKGL